MWIYVYNALLKTLLKILFFFVSLNKLYKICDNIEKYTIHLTNDDWNEKINWIQFFMRFRVNQIIFQKFSSTNEIICLSILTYNHLSNLTYESIIDTINIKYINNIKLCKN